MDVQLFSKLFGCRCFNGAEWLWTPIGGQLGDKLKQPLFPSSTMNSRFLNQIIKLQYN